jgi:polysaccharide deacetylase 2 family uncharacterized protein YibQ
LPQRKPLIPLPTGPLFALIFLSLFALGWFFFLQGYFGPRIIEETESYVVTRERGQRIFDYQIGSQNLEKELWSLLQGAGVFPAAAGPDFWPAQVEEMIREEERGLIKWSHRSQSLVSEVSMEEVVEKLADFNPRYFLRVTPGEGELFIEAGFPPEDNPVLTHSLLLQFPSPPPPPPGPQIAIIIDDWGYNWEAAEAFLNLPPPLNVAVMPHLPRSEEHARRAHLQGHTVLLHLPMEPLSGMEAGPGMIKAEHRPEEILERLTGALEDVPHVVGINNHMGSKATSDPRVMYTILRYLGETDLFFVDSNTAPQSVVAPIARGLGVPFGVNQVFLDNVAEVEAIHRQVEKLIAIAERQGRAIGIGHVKAETAQVLQEMATRWEELGITLVSVTELLEHPPGLISWPVQAQGQGLGDGGRHTMVPHGQIGSR